VNWPVYRHASLQQAGCTLDTILQGRSESAAGRVRTNFRSQGSYLGVRVAARNLRISKPVMLGFGSPLSYRSILAAGPVSQGGMSTTSAGRKRRVRSDLEGCIVALAIARCWRVRSQWSHRRLQPSGGLSSSRSVAWRMPSRLVKGSVVCAPCGVRALQRAAVVSYPSPT
jgi:hypothetical protein